MAKQQGSGIFVPLIIIGATIFGLGAYQALRPKPVEINPTFEAVDNPRTMQAPPPLAASKDAAQLAAEAGATEDKASAELGADKTIKLNDAPWLKSIMGGVLGEFRGTVVTALKKEQAKGDLNCSPVLTKATEAELKALDEVSCTDKEGAVFTGQFDSDGDGSLEIKSPDMTKVSIEKSGGSFSVTVDEP
jgi:hypothetical protein